MTLNPRGSLSSLIVLPLFLVACSSNSSTIGGSGDGSGGHTGSGGAPSSGSGGAFEGTGGSGSGGSSGSGGAIGSGGSDGSGGHVDAGSSGSGGSRRDAAADMTTGGGSGGKSGGSGGTTGAGGTTGGDPRCQAANLTWKTGAKTNFESYPAPGSDECIKYSGCMYEGEFAACNNTEPESWVMTHNIVAAFPLGNLSLHDLCLKSGSKTIVVTVLDTCADSDCSGCCTQNKGSASLLIDVEKYTDQRWGVADGDIQWADLGATTGGGCK